MRLSIFTSITSPETRGDNWRDAFQCYEDLADEVVIVDGTIYEPETVEAAQWFLKEEPSIKHILSPWPKEFSWEFIGQQFQKGYEAATGDWVMHCDIDMIFHERDFGRIRQALRDYPTAPAISFYKWQFVLPDRYNLKSRLILVVNKKEFGDRIKFNGGGDLCQPTLDGKDMDLNEIPQAGIPFYNYEHLLKTKDQTNDDVARMDRAYHRYFGKWLYSEDGSEESAFDGWVRMVRGRYQKPSQVLEIYKHPKYVQKTIENLRPDQFGYNGWSLL